MTQQELRNSTMNLIKVAIEKQCYIKGYGAQFRVMDATHSPIMNISREQMNVLSLNKIFRMNGLIWTLQVTSNPFTHPLEVQLPGRL